MQNLHDYCKFYLETYKKPFIKNSTYERYLSCMCHVPKLPLCDVSEEDIQMIINKLIALGRKTSTIKQVKIIIMQSLKRAKKQGIINQIDFDLILPKNSKVKVQALSSAEQQLVLHNLDLSFYGDMFFALMHSGCRCGELIALTWSDVDFRNNVMHITKTDYNGHVGTPKTVDSFRDVPLHPDLRMQLLKKYKVGKNGLVFRSTLGTAVNYHSLLDAWHRYLDLLNLPRHGLHVLRHTFATNALSSGMNYKILSKILGHGSVAVTMDIYCDILEEDKQRAMLAMSEHAAEWSKKKAWSF